MENIMKPEPHKIIHVVRQTTAEFTIRVACDKDPGYGQFFQLSLPKIGQAHGKTATPRHFRPADEAGHHHEP